MPPDLDRRTYDVLRLIRTHEPIGSIRLVDLLDRRGYSIEGRTVRLVLSELDERGLTEKVPGKGRQLTDRGRAELARGDVTGRLEQARARIATLTNGVTYDPAEGEGELATSTATVAQEDVSSVRKVLERLDDSPLGPVRLATDRQDDDTVRLSFPSSITLDGVLLSAGIRAELKTAGIVEYLPDTDNDRIPSASEMNEDRRNDGTILRYTDVISDKASSLDVVRLLIEADRTDVDCALAREGPGLLVVDNREAPLESYDEAVACGQNLSDSFGGVVDVRRPRETGPFPQGGPDWDFLSITYGGLGENALALLTERGLTRRIETLGTLRRAAEFSSVNTLKAG